MTPIEVLREAQATELVDEDGDRVELELLPGLTDAELQDFSSTLPCTVPPEISRFLKHSRGFEGSAADQVDLTGRDLSFGMHFLFNHALPIASDGFGNFWVADLSHESTDWAPVYFVCHDPPVLLFQSPSLEHFLVELFKMHKPPHESLVDDVHEDRPYDVWRTNPGVLTYAECAGASDPILRSFAEQIDESYQVIDLRAAEIGFGFSWGRYGPKTVIERHGSLPVFAYRRPAGFFRRLLGR